MATNLLQPNGLSVSRPRMGGAPSYQQNLYLIKNGYGSKIGVGDLVAMDTSGGQGYIRLATTGDTTVLGVFVGVAPYYETTTQDTRHGLNGAYVTTITPPTGVDVPCYVIDDPFLTFKVQMSGTWNVNMAGNNIQFAGNGAPNAAGRSTLSVDGTTTNTTATLPLRVLGTLGYPGGPQDPGNVNPWIEVRINTSSQLSTTGI